MTSSLNSETTLKIVKQYVWQLQQAIPIFWWNISCFSKLRTIRSTFRAPNTFECSSRTEVESEHILTHVDSNRFDTRHCGIRDISPDFPDRFAERCFAFRINFSKHFCFANEQSVRQFCDARTAVLIHSMDRCQNDYVQFCEGFYLNGIHFRHALIALPQEDSQLWFGSLRTFWALSICLLSWPLRILLEYNTFEVNYSIIKLLGEKYGKCDSPLVSSPMESASNFYIVPSYSESIAINHQASPESLKRMNTSGKLKPSFSCNSVPNDVTVKTASKISACLSFDDIKKNIHFVDMPDRASEPVMLRSHTDRDISRVCTDSLLDKSWIAYTNKLSKSDFV